MSLRERFNQALEAAVIKLRSPNGPGFCDYGGEAAFRLEMLGAFEESPNLPIDVGNEVIQFLEDLPPVNH